MICKQMLSVWVFLKMLHFKGSLKHTVVVGERIAKESSFSRYNSNY